MDSSSGFFSMDEPNLDPKWLIDPKLLFVGPRIGEGARAKVYEGKYKHQNVAIKIIHKGDNPEKVVKREGRFMKGVPMLSIVNHKNLVKRDYDVLPTASVRNFKEDGGSFDGLCVISIY